MLSFVLLFPNLKDQVGFYGDVGQIPYRFKKNYNLDVKCIAYENSDIFEIFRHHLELITIPESFGDFKLLYYLFRNRKKIDILNVYHIGWNSLLYSFIYKLFNPKGFVYLKMDNNHSIGIYPWEKIFNPKLVPVSFLFYPRETIRWKIKKLLIKKFFIKKVDLFSVEDKQSKIYFENNYSFFKDKLICLRNGYALDLLKTWDFEKIFHNKISKSNIILSVARFGSFQKASEVLIKAFLLTCERHNWELHLAGTMTDEFKNFLEKVFFSKPELRKRIKCYGFLKKEQLLELYLNSKIFVLPSRYEGFAISLAEAMITRNVIITTDKTSLSDDIQKNHLGIIVNVEDVEGLSSALLKFILDPELLEKTSNECFKYAYENYNWDENIKILHTEILSRLKKR